MTFQEIVKFVIDNGDVYFFYQPDGRFDVYFQFYKNNGNVSVEGHYVYDHFYCSIDVKKLGEKLHFSNFYDSNIKRSKQDYIDAVELTEYVNESGVLND